MTIETYPAMNAEIVKLLRIASEAPSLLYAAQRIEELEQIADIRDECLKMALQLHEEYQVEYGLTPHARAIERLLYDIEQRLAELEPKEIPNANEKTP